MTPSYLSGHFLVSMPQMHDLRFARSVVYLCAHSPQGAMGFVINRALNGVTFADLLQQLKIENAVNPQKETLAKMPVFYGGPVENNRGFVLHSDDILRDASTPIQDNIALTATVDMLDMIAKGKGPEKHLLVLGYAGWGAGQLEQEIQQNSWLTVPGSEEIIFDQDAETKWNRLYAQIGVLPNLMSREIGHA